LILDIFNHKREVMLNFIKNFLTNNTNTDNIDLVYSTDEKLQLATCALFLEVANSDDDFSKVEKQFIIKTMKKQFQLDDNLVEELIEGSKVQTEKSVSLYEFTKIINNSFNKQEKIAIVKSLWQLVFADGVMNKYEEYFVRKISNNLHLEHSEIIAAKLEAKKEAKE